MKNFVIMTMLFCLCIACTGCGSSDNSGQLADQQTQIAALQADLAAIRTQLVSAQGQGNTYSAGIDTAIASLTLTQNSLAQLTGQPASTANTIPLTTASNQVIVLQSLADSLTSNTATAAAGGMTGTKDATIASLNATVATLNATIAGMVATPVLMSASSLTAIVSTSITVTATFPASLNGKSATFSSTGGSLGSTSVVIASGSASTTFSSATAGAFNIYAVQGAYAGGMAVYVSKAPDSFAYVVNALSNNISAFSIDPVTGALSQLPGSPFAAGSYPISLTVTPSCKYGYVVNSPDGSNVIVTAYAINSSTGALAAIGAPVQIGSNPGVAPFPFPLYRSTVDPSGLHLYVPNFMDSKIYVFNIAPDTGMLSSVAGSPFPTDNYPVALVFDPAGTHLYVTTSAGGSGDGTLSVYSVDGSGSLTPIFGSPFVRDLASMSLPANSIVMDPLGKYLYTPTNDGKIAAFSIDASSGAPAPLMSIGPNSGDPLDMIALKIDLSGNYLYSFGTNVPGGGDLMTSTAKASTLSIDRATGMLTQVGTPLGSAFYNLFPSLTMSPSGQYLYGITSAGAISIYGVPVSSGALTPVGSGAAAGTFPIDIVTIKIP